MRHVTPHAILIAQPTLNWDAIRRYLAEDVGGDAETWADRVQGHSADGEALVEFGGRLCYRSWTPGLNANVTKVRENSRDYHRNVLSSGHGSVTEHANYSFIFADVSRVFTHEQVRHRAGVAVSQESMRFVRLTDIPFWFPEWARGDEELMRRNVALLTAMEEHQLWMAEHFELDATEPCDACGGKGVVHYVEGEFESECGACKGEAEVSKVPFSEKKHKTSFMRRFAPDGVATAMLCTMNVRSLRHIIYMRTSLGAEEEIRLVMDSVAEQALAAVPDLMQDYSPNEHREWVPDFLKV